MKSTLSKTAKSLVAAAALTVGLGVAPPTMAADPFIAQIVMFGGNFAPPGWALCDGQLLSISSNTALFSILGTTYGGDGETTFALPDLRGRTAVHPGSGPGLTPIQLGQKGGAETQTLSVSNMPSHNHTVTLRATSTDGNQTGPSGHILANDPREDQYSDATPNVSMNAAATEVSNTGGGQSFGVRDPFLAVNHIIALVGIFPSPG